MKKFFKYFAVIMAALMLVGCTGSKPGSGIQNTHVTPDPIKDGEIAANQNQDVKPEGGEATDVNPDSASNGTGDENSESKPAVLPDYYEKDYVVTDNAGIIETVHAYTADGKELWTYTTDEILVGQYDSTCLIGETEKGVYYVEDGVLVCLNKEDGKVLWKSDERVGVSVSYAFDEDGNIYIAGYTGPELTVIDPDGKTLYYVESLANSDEYKDEFFWANGVYLEEGKIYKSYESSNLLLEIDPETGKASREEFGGNADWSELPREWKMTSWAATDGSSSDSSGDKYEVEITENYWISVKRIKENGTETSFEYKQLLFRPYNLYDGFDDSYYGTWCGVAYCDEKNMIGVELTEPETLELIWFDFDDDGTPKGYTIATFFGA